MHLPVSSTSNNDLDEGDCWKTMAAFIPAHSI